jgi:hypothetical protein
MKSCQCDLLENPTGRGGGGGGVRNIYAIVRRDSAEGLTSGNLLAAVWPAGRVGKSGLQPVSGCQGVALSCDSPSGCTA